MDTRAKIRGTAGSEAKMRIRELVDEIAYLNKWLIEHNHLKADELAAENKKIVEAMRTSSASLPESETNRGRRKRLGRICHEQWLFLEKAIDILKSVVAGQQLDKESVKSFVDEIETFHEKCKSKGVDDE